MPPLLYISREEVEELLPYGPCIELMAGALRALGEGRAQQPLRSVLRLSDAPGAPARGGLLGMMPGALSPWAPAWAPEESGTAGGDAGAFGIKVVTIFPGNHARGLESHQGAVLLFEPDTGALVAILDGAAVTAIRTAAVSALATRLLAREDAVRLALLGSGVQARTHLAALREVRGLRDVRVWSRSFDHAREFAARESARHGIPIEPAGSVREAVAAADLICTTTSSREPVLLGEWVPAGSHINAVGACFVAARELDGAAVARSRLFVDSRESAHHESGDLRIAQQEGAVGEDHVAGELGDLLLGRVAGRREAAEVTLFKSLGLAVEDVATARYVYEQALARGKGVELAAGAAAPAVAAAGLGGAGGV